MVYNRTNSFFFLIIILIIKIFPTCLFIQFNVYILLNIIVLKKLDPDSFMILITTTLTLIYNFISSIVHKIIFNFSSKVQAENVNHRNKI